MLKLEMRKQAKKNVKILGIWAMLVAIVASAYAAGLAQEWLTYAGGWVMTGLLFALVVAMALYLMYGDTYPALESIVTQRKLNKKAYRKYADYVDRTGCF